jgi:hypothetical protein
MATKNKEEVVMCLDMFLFIKRDGNDISSVVISLFVIVVVPHTCSLTGNGQQCSPRSAGTSSDVIVVVVVPRC